MSRNLTTCHGKLHINMIYHLFDIVRRDIIHYYLFIRIKNVLHIFLFDIIMTGDISTPQFLILSATGS